MNSPEYEEWKVTPTPENLSKVMTSLSPTINSEVQRYTGPKPLLRGKAKLLTVNAIKSYDATRGAQLRSWVVTQLQPLSRYGQQLRPIHASEVAIRQAAEVNRVREEMSEDIGRDPTPEELADKIGISASRIKKLREQVKPAVAESTLLADEESVQSLPGTSEVNRVDIAEDSVYESLSIRDKQIFDWKTGKHGKTALPNQDIAKRLGVTPALISQRSQQIAVQIQALHGRGVL